MATDSKPGCRGTSPSVNGAGTLVQETPKKQPINLLRGWPAPSLLPTSLLRAAAARVLSDPAIAVPALQYGPDPGYEPLRAAVAGWLARSYDLASLSRPRSRSRCLPGGPVGADEVAITGGASQGLACVLQSFTDPWYTRRVWMAAPCYFLAGPLFEDAGFAGRLRAVREDAAGLDVRWLEERRKAEEDGVCKSPGPHRRLYRHVVYLVATSSNPSGRTLPLARRQALIRLARRYDVLVISDDVYDFLQWPTSPASPSPAPGTAGPPALLPTLSLIDAALPHDDGEHPDGRARFGNAVSNASFSKLAGPGIRTGWIHGTLALVHGFAQTGSNRSGGAASQFAAAVVHQVLVTGELERWLGGVVRPALRRRHAAVLGAIAAELAGLGVRVAGDSGGAGGAGGLFGGYFVWLGLPEGVQADEVAARAREEEELIVAPGRLFEVKGDEEAARFPGHLRLCFSWEDEADVVEGVRRLGRVLRRVLDGAAPGAGAGAEGAGRGVDIEELEKQVQTAC
ncbi:PLP-dependent transferase [Trichocladium antarcticum]|uniref:PLP-dependent transferase n=1 Tax=Trichocladium antarcticum TaxID=1450529 RepID=A0AAN6ZA64_9PEZI|nr:PLP-dependent transferase [Trichocladium antarcticum]